MFYKDESMALFFDGPNFYSTVRSLDFDVDYKCLLQYFKERGRLLRASYFTPIADTDDFIAIRPLVDWMQYNGWNVVTKRARTLELEDGRKRIKGNTDVELVIEAIKLSSSVKHVVLFTGNKDFISLVRFLQERGVRVTIVSSTQTVPPASSDELRRQADCFIELEDLHYAIARETSDEAAA